MTIIADGAMGTELSLRGFPLRAPATSAAALMDAPELVREIHLESIRAGAQVLTTNSFALTVVDAAAARRSVALAREAIEESGTDGVRIAGSVGPHAGGWAELAAALRDAGSDLVLLETFTDLQRATAAVQAVVAAVKQIPVWLSVACGPDGRLLGGAAPTRQGMEGLHALLVGCTEGAGLAPALATGVFDGVVPSTGATIGTRFVPDAIDPAALADIVVALARQHALAIVGGCCGTSPQWIASVAARLHADPSARAAAFRDLHTRLQGPR